VFLFYLCVRWNGGRKVFENRDRLREKPRREAAISKEKNANFCLWSRKQKTLEGREYTYQGLREDKANRRRNPQGGKTLGGKRLILLSNQQ
jgi:hypothetical protein